jgi:hypothetical protein
MMSESDGMSELFEDAVRQAVMVSARLGEQLAQYRHAQLGEARRASEQAARQLAARFDAERLSARAALQGADSRDWWKSATPEQIGAAFETATAWRDHDPEIAALHAQISDRLERRGIDHTVTTGKATELIRARQWAAQYEPELSASYTRELIHAPATDRERMNNTLLAAYLARPDAQLASAADTERAAAATNKQDAAGLRRDASADVQAGVGAREEADALRRADEAKLGSSALLAGGELPPDPHREDSAPPAEAARSEIATAANRAGRAYDSAERRAKFASRLEGKGTEQDVNARLLADLSQGTPATAAVQQHKTAVARKTKTPARPSRQLAQGSR